MPSAEPVAGAAARRAALVMLDGVLRFDRTLDATSGAARGLAAPDAALAMAIAGEVLRRLPDLDALIDSATRLPLAPDAKARMVLRIALAQRIALGTPPHAILATALPLVDGGPRRLVHGVLGTLFRRDLPPLDAPRLPDAVEDRWGEAWGEEMVLAARRSIVRRPALDLAFADDAAAQTYAAANGGTSLAPRHVRLAGAGSVTDLPGYSEGAWWVQDLASTLPVRLMPGEPGRVLDLCAAPGGKTMQLAALGHLVIAVDRSESRLARLRENLARTGLSAELVVGDARSFVTDPADAVLLDAPCSATGTFRRHPEVLYRARPAIVAEMAALQSAMLDHSARLVKLGGSLVYAVCSLESQEGEEQVTAFLSSHPGWRLDTPRDGELPDGLTSSPEGWVRILPGMMEAAGGLDGFFVARLVRSAD